MPLRKAWKSVPKPARQLISLVIGGTLIVVGGLLIVLQILVADVELPTDTSITPKNDVRKDRKPDLYNGILKY